MVDEHYHGCFSNSNGIRFVDVARNYGDVRHDSIS